MTAIQEPADAALLSKRVRDAIIEPYELDGHQIVIDISIGISIAPDDAIEPDQLLKNSDMALYGAKSDGRGIYRFFEPEMDARMKARRELEMDLRKALINNEFELHYQPLINLETRDISAFEALLRWNHPTRGVVSPGEFIPIAEETGIIIPLGEWVLKKACAETTSWPDHIKVAVNLSPAQLKSRNLVEVGQQRPRGFRNAGEQIAARDYRNCSHAEHVLHARDAAQAAPAGHTDRDG